MWEQEVDLTSVSRKNEKNTKDEAALQKCLKLLEDRKSRRRGVAIVTFYLLSLSKI